MLAGSPFSQEIEFSTGLPTGALTYSVLGHDGNPLVGYDGLTVSPASGAVSHVLIVPGAANTSLNPLFENRTLTWSYTTANGTVTDEVSYRVDKRIPFPVTRIGVRSKLGVEAHEIEDHQIDLLFAYASLSSLYTAGVIDSYAIGGDLDTLIVTNAIEAYAALSLIPSLQLAVAKKEDSGTNKYERFASIDWEALQVGLQDYISKVDVLIGVSSGGYTGGILFFAAGPTGDPVTGADYAV